MLLYFPQFPEPYPKINHHNEMIIYAECPRSRRRVAKHRKEFEKAWTRHPGYCSSPM